MSAPNVEKAWCSAWGISECEATISAPPPSAGWTGVAYSTGYSDFCPSAAWRSSSSACESGMVRIHVIKGLASDLEIAYNSGVQTPYTQGLAAANSWNALKRGMDLTDSLADPPGGSESMTYILYRVLRRMPRPVLVALLVVLMTALARA
jgi:hypothetical protein